MANARRKRKKKYPVHYYVGVVTAISAGRRVTCKVNRRSVKMRYNAGFSPIIGSTVRVVLTRGRWSCVGPISDGEVTIPAGDDAPELPASGTHGPLRPIYAGTWTGARWVAGDLVQGTRLAAAQIGCAFYGTGPAVLLRGDVTEVRLTLRGADTRAVGTVNIRPVVETQRPNGAPTFALGGVIATADLVGAAPVTVVLPDAGEHFIDGDWGGIAIHDPDPSTPIAVGLDLDSLTLNMDWSS